MPHLEQEKSLIIFWVLIKFEILRYYTMTLQRTGSVWKCCRS